MGAIGSRIQMEEAFSPFGVRLNVFDEVIQRICLEEGPAMDEHELRKLTTDQVCQMYIKKWTTNDKVSYREMRTRREGAQDELANAFISHAWAYSFVDLIEALKHHFQQTGEQDSVVVWMDVLTHNQHTTQSLEFKDWCNAFFGAIKTFSRTAMLLSPWDDPVPLKRAWCLFELYATIQGDARFEVALPAGERDRFNGEQGKRFGSFEEMLSRVDVRKSEAKLADDKAKILELVEERVGLAEVNRMVFDQMRGWVIEAARSNLNEAVRVLGETHPNTLLATTSLAALYESQGKDDLAEPLYASCLKKSRAVLGDDHPDTLASMSSLADLYESQGKYDAAEPLCKACLEKTKSLLGEDHPDTLASMSSLAALYKSQAKYDAAEPLFVLCWEKSKAVLGENHPDTLTFMNNLAGLYKSQANYDAAEPLFLLCFEKRKIVLGDNHPTTLTTMYNLAALYESRGKYVKAEPLFVSCFERRKEVLGEDHPDTMVSMSSLAGCYNHQGKYDASERLFTSCWEQSKEALGESHPTTLALMTNLTEFFFKSRRLRCCRAPCRSML
eukprot:c20141_g2_i1.p1 GENE.c20141_g2_i1~~c20141_g2_i1.p1  ORF type:complete len:557 (+),score=125.85 c20141_g2_i1:2-1672(+)